MYSVRIGKQLLELSHPLVMGIVNVTPDSFSVHCSSCKEAEIMSVVSGMLQAGAGIIDVGGYSTRPGAAFVSEDEEWHRVSVALRAIRSAWSGAVVSLDTFRSSIALKAVEEYGPLIINDVSGGLWDENMFDAVSRARVPYILTHTRWVTPQQALSPAEDDVVSEVLHFLEERLDRLHRMGVADVIIDPGFGLGKTVEESFTLLRELAVFRTLHCPLLAGLSRKSMLFKPLDISPMQALNATTAANTLALAHGADILRVHDVQEAQQVVRIHRLTFPD
ncbi:MAG: dihydropteroate synthase [Paludibacteraceae bacterium]|nr:dihydropteroate synthase [Paludibacteraceae bacterium]